MPRVQGHSIEEQWDLSQQFEALTEHALAQTVDTYLALATGKVLTAAAGFEGNPSIHAIWQQQVDAALTPFLYATFESAALGVAHDVANGSELPAGAGVPLVPDDHVASYVAQVSNKMVGISNDLWQQINVSLQQGVQLGESIDELAARVQQAGAVTTVRAQATARTTVVQASNAGSLTQMQMLGDDTVTKEWLATEDTRTRHDHSVADGQKRQLTAAFDIGGWPMQYPGDPAGPADEVINCRCTIVYNYDTQPAYVCDCASADKIIAAGYLTTPTTVPASSCVCPVTASLHTPGYVSPVEAYGPIAKSGVYKAFQKPGKISPAYGGAKIHKQLEPIKNALSLTDADADALLTIIDEQYALAGGKSSFKAKYEEWLNSAAGKKVVKVPLSVPAPAATATTPITTSGFSAAKSVTTLEKTFLPPEVTSLENILSDIDLKIHTHKPFSQAWADNVGKLNGLPHLSTLTDDEKIAVLKKFAEKNYPGSFDVMDWPDTVTGTPSVSTATVTAPAPAVVAPSVVTPTIVTPATVTTPAVIDPLDISMSTYGQQLDLLKAFKAVKPVTPNWGGSAIMKTLQQAKTSLGPGFAKYNDGQLLKMLDAVSKPSGKTYFNEATEWLKTPAGKKYAISTGAPTIPAATATVTPAGAPAAGALGDISGIHDAVKQLIFNKIKGHGVYLSSPPSKMWDTFKLIKSDPAYKNLTDLQLVRILDEVGAKKLGVANGNLYETKLVKWMKTKPGKDYMAGIKPTPAAPVTPAGYVPVNLASIPRNISSTDTVFANLSNTEAQAMQNAQTAWSTKERQSLRYYTSNNYTAMNGALRKGSDVPPVLADHIRNAQAGMRPSTRPMLLYRGTGVSQLGLSSGASLSDIQALVGKTLEDKGFMSTSTNVGASFSGAIKLEIEAPTGSPMAFVKSISHYSTEDEMLLAAGTRFQVLSVTKTGGYTTVVRVRIVP